MASDVTLWAWIENRTLAELLAFGEAASGIGAGIWNPRSPWISSVPAAVAARDKLAAKGIAYEPGVKLASLLPPGGDIHDPSWAERAAPLVDSYHARGFKRLVVEAESFFATKDYTYWGGSWLDRARGRLRDLHAERFGAVVSLLPRDCPLVWYPSAIDHAYGTANLPWQRYIDFLALALPAESCMVAIASCSAPKTRYTTTAKRDLADDYMRDVVGYAGMVDCIYVGGGRWNPSDLPRALALVRTADVYVYPVGSTLAEQIAILGQCAEALKRK